MQTRSKSAGRWLFTLAVAAGLTFGGRSALASAPNASACPWDPEHGQPGISCRVSADCEDVCWFDGQWVDGFCGGDGCCVCPW